MEPIKKKPKYECDNCMQTFDRAERLEKHIEKGCNRTTCTTCNEKFDDVRRLQQHERMHEAEALTICTTCSKKFPCQDDLHRHQKNADPKVCDSCDIIFCHESELERHKRTKHVGGEIRTDNDFETALDQPICPRTGFEEKEGYKEEVKDHWSEIRDMRKESRYYMDINKELSPDFTYKDLKKLLKEICIKLGHASKVNIGFGFMLRDNVTDEYRYFYVSTNNMIFDRAITLSKNADINDLMKRILDLDLMESYYMKRPSSGWVLAGLPNIFIKVMYMKKTVFG